MKVLAFFLFTVSLYSNRQTIDWEKTANWKLYKVGTRESLTITADSLLKRQSIFLDSLQMKKYLHAIQIWPKEKTASWMGFFVATYELEDHAPRKVLISTYGGFFYDESTKRYYEIADPDKQNWLNFLNETSKAMIYQN